MFEKREYQTHCVDETIAQVSNLRKVVLQSPTGSGKSHMFALITKRYTENAGKAVLILVHRIELLHQAEKTIFQSTGIKPCLITAETKKFQIARVYIGMVESLKNRLELIENVGLVILDEAHVDNFKKIHSVFLEEMIIGFTATPISASKKDPMRNYYNAIVCGPQISELIANGFLAQNVTRVNKDAIDVRSLSVDVLSGDYNERQMATEYKLPRYILQICKKYRQFCQGEKCIVYNVNIEHSLEVTEAMQVFGINARHVDATSTNKPSCRDGFKNERDEIFDWFKTTKDAVLCNCMVATVGIDEPTIRWVILNFDTLSLCKFIQTSGRGSRPIDERWLEQHQIEYPYEERTKKWFGIIDMGTNYDRFGDWSDERDWQRIFNFPQTAGEGIAPMKTCPDCEGLVHAAIRVCNLQNSKGEYCLHEFAPKPRSAEEDIDEMLMITKSIDIKKLMAEGHNKYKYYTFGQLAHPVIQEMFKIHGKEYTQDGVIYKFFKIYYSACIDWYAREIAANNEEVIDDISNSSFHINKALTNFNALIKHYAKNYELKVETLDLSKPYAGTHRLSFVNE